MRQTHWFALIIAAVCLYTLAFLSLSSPARAQIETPTALAGEIAQNTPAPPLEEMLPPLTEAPSTLAETPFALDSTPTPQPGDGFTAAMTPTVTITSTTTVTPTVTVTPTITVEPTVTPTIPVSPSLIRLPQIHYDYSPAVTATPTPTPTPRATETLLVCRNANKDIPDSSTSGVKDKLTITSDRIVYDINVYLDITHSWVGDLVVSLLHEDSGRSVALLNRPGSPATSGGCNRPNVGAILDDEMSLPAHSLCASADAAIAGIYLPYSALTAFDGDTAGGTWTLNAADVDLYSTGSLDRWCVQMTVGDAPLPTTPTPTPVSLPASARISNITSKHQALPLDCESRVAVDWAAYFGYIIDEMDFFYHLPVSDNPDAGFVGNVNGSWGKIPPNDYGVHGEPIAALLRDRYGVPAYVQRPMSFERLKAEIAANRPVYVWIVGGGSNYHFEIPVYYTSADQHTSIVAPYEHTVMVIGYSETNVTILDGGNIYTPSNFQFLASWSALENMALIAEPE